jgi:hypothetical protein
MTPLAELLKPYTLYLIYAQIFLLSLAIFVGALLIIRRLWKRQPVEGALIQDREKLAAEIHEEILRLEDLRNRLDPSFMLAGQDVAARPISAKLHSSRDLLDADLGDEGEKAVSSGERLTSSGFTEFELQERIESATQDLMKEIAELTEKLAQAEEALRAQGSSPVDSGVAAASSEEWEQLKKEIEDLNLKLEDYRAFEDELALVKQYKVENEELRKQLEARGPLVANAAGEETLKISEEDIASLFEEMGMPSEEVAEEKDFDENEEKTVFKAESESEPDLVTRFAASEDEEQVDEPLLVSQEAETDADPEEELLAKGFEKEKTIQEPALPEINEDTAEALAELGDDDDELMAEFEKVLGSKEHEK